MSGSNSDIPDKNRGLTYKDAGVDIEAGAQLIERIAPAAKATRRPELLSDLGGFAAMAELPEGYEKPYLGLDLIDPRSSKFLLSGKEAD